MSRYRHRACGVVFAMLAVLANAAWASDRAKEQRWADQIVDFLVVGEAVWLSDDAGKFLGLFTEPSAEPAKGAVIVVHGLGAHPDWQDVVAPLRAGLPEHGWATLSVQMPILANDADPSEYGPLFAEVPGRLDAAVAYLKEHGYDNIVVAAHSLGTAMTASYLAQQGKASGDIAAFVAMGMRDGHGNDPRMHTAAFLKDIAVPMLDLYGAQDNEAVQSATVRRSAGKAQGTYEQTEVPGTDHFFRGKSDRLVEIVAQWLEPYARSSASR